MKENFIYLTYYQAMAFMYEINKLKENNPYFKDGISSSYEEYVIKRTTEITTTYPQIKLKILPNADKYKISDSMFGYLTRLTKIDVLDENVIKSYISQIDSAENKSYNLAKSKLEETNQGRKHK